MWVKIIKDVISGATVSYDEEGNQVLSGGTIRFKAGEVHCMSETSARKWIAAGFAEATSAPGA